MNIGQLIGILLILLLLLVGATYILSEQRDVYTTPTIASVGGEQLVRSNSGSGATTTVTTHVTHIVEYTDEGFVPHAVYVHEGDSVQFVNTSDELMWVASLPHETHSAYSETAYPTHCSGGSSVFDQCAPGDKYEFIVEKAGEWDFHNHLAPQAQGTIYAQK